MFGSPVVITPMRRRHLRQVLRIDHQVYPRPWSLGLYLGELSTTEGRSYVVARQGTEVSVSASPDAFEEFLAQDGKFWVDLVKSAKVKVD